MLQIIRGDVGHLPRVVLFTIAGIGVYNFGWGFADPYLSIYLQQFTSSYAGIGFFETLIKAASLLLLIPIGDLLDRVNHHYLLVGAKIGYFFVGALYFLAGHTGSMTFLIAALVLNGALIPLIWTTSSATIHDYATMHDAALVSGLYATVRHLTWAVGLAIALLIVADYPIHYIFIPVMIFPVLSIPFHLHQPEKHHEPLLSGLKDVIVQDKLIGRWWRDIHGMNSEAAFMYMLVFAMSIVPTFAVTFIPLYAESIGFSLAEIGLLVLAMSLPYLLSFLAAELADHYARLSIVGIGACIATGSFFALSLWRSEPWHIYVFGCTLVLGYAFTTPSINSIITVLTPKKYIGIGTALIFVMTYLSGMVLSPVLGELVDVYDWSITLQLLSVLLLIVTIGVVAIHRLYTRRNLHYHINHPQSKNEPYIL